MMDGVFAMNKLISTVNLFKKGLSKLKVDFLNSLHIQEAQLSRLHLERRIRRDYEKRRQMLRMHQRHGIHLVDRQGREVAFLPSTLYSIPTQKHNSSPTDHPLLTALSSRRRRPQQHVRQMSRDLQTTLPTVAAFLFIPFAGYSFLFLGMVFPRLLLSRQFHTRNQRWEFATKEFSFRRQWFERLNSDYWGSCMRNMPELVLYQDTGREEGELLQSLVKQNNSKDIPLYLEPLSYIRMDSAGPVFSRQSMLTLYHLLQCSGGNTSESPSISNLQPSHLHSLALSNNLASTMLLPSSLSPLFLQTFLPYVYLQQRLTTLAEDIIMDDISLIEEGQLDNECIDMTEEEVLDSCWLRGLPVGRFATNMNMMDSEGETVQSMRKVLTHHLQMMDHVFGTSLHSKLVRDTTLQLLVLHLPAIRYRMMTTSKNKLTVANF